MSSLLGTRKQPQPPLQWKRELPWSQTDVRLHVRFEIPRTGVSSLTLLFSHLPLLSPRSLF